MPKEKVVQMHNFSVDGFPFLRFTLSITGRFDMNGQKSHNDDEHEHQQEAAEQRLAGWWLCSCRNAAKPINTQPEDQIMKEKTATKENVNQEKPMADMTDKAMKNYETALRAGLKLQEEAVRCWSNIFNQTATAQDWQKRFSNFTCITSEVMPLTQRRMEEVLDLMEQNGRTSAELMKKAVDAAQTPVPAESQAKWMDFWTSSLGAMRSNAEAISQINARAIDSWIDFVRQNTEVTEIRVPKAA